MSRIQFEILESNAVICKDKTCSYKRECANHDTAGDFRSDSGFTPQLFVLNNKTEIDCYTKDQSVHENFLDLPCNLGELDMGMYVIPF